MVKLLELEKQRVRSAVTEVGEGAKVESMSVDVKRSEEEQVEGKEESADEEGTLESLLIDDTAEMVADIRYTIHEDVYNEIHYTLRGGLALRPPKEPNGQPIPRTITLLQTPQDGAIEFLDSVVETVAQDVGADLIRLDAQISQRPCPTSLERIWLGTPLRSQHLAMKPQESPENCKTTQT